MSEVRVPPWLGFGANSFSGLQVAAFLLCAHMVYPCCPQEREATNLIGLGPHPYNLTRGVRTPTYQLGGGSGE